MMLGSSMDVTTLHSKLRSTPVVRSDLDYVCIKERRSSPVIADDDVGNQICLFLQ